MIKYLIKKKVKREAEEKGKKMLLYSGVVITGVGAYCSYKAIKKYKQNRNSENYLDDSEYDIYAYDEYGCDHECGCESYEEVNEENFPKDELEEKIEEFNSRRITDENTPDADVNEMESKLNKVGNNKIDIKINENNYKEDDYNKYDHYENDLKK
ncbi:hypothetical protein [Faecalimicrobium sp. JNUCC 81]